MVRLEIPLTPPLIQRLEEKIYRNAGNPENMGLLNKLARPLASALAVAKEHARPRAVARSLKVLHAGQDAVVTDAGPINSAMFAFLVNQCAQDRRVVFMLATIGDALESAGASCRDVFDQWVFDTVGSELIEMAVNQAQRRLKDRLFKHPVGFSRRISPGYCDWPIDGQQTVFNALDAGRIGVTLSPVMVMTPRKSISGVAAAAESVPVKNPCSRCLETKCRWRR